MELTLDKITVSQLEKIIQQSVASELKKERANIFLAMQAVVSADEQAEIEHLVGDIENYEKEDFKEYSFD